MSDGREDELDDFKRNVNLIQYSALNGFVYSNNESTETYAVLRKESPKEKLIITKALNGHWIYFNVHDDNDRGTIVDFIQTRKSINLGLIRKDLRAWLGSHSVKIQSKNFPSVKTSNFNREAVVSSLSRTTYCTSSPYLNSRGIPNSVLVDPRFRNMVRIDSTGNILFPHYDKQGLTGYEIKNEDYTGFAKYGRRSLWSSQCFKDDHTIVFTESAIDAFSYHIINGHPGMRYHSVAGAIGGHQQPLLVSVLKKALMNNWLVIDAFDRDDEGNKYHNLIQELAPESLVIDRQVPNEKDWNQAIDLRLTMNG